MHRRSAVLARGCGIPRPAGSGTRRSGPARTHDIRPQVQKYGVTTRSPTASGLPVASAVSPSPSSAISQTISWPMANGQGNGNSPRKMCRSDPQIPAMRNFSAAVPGAGVDSGNSASSIGPPYAVNSASLGMTVPLSCAQSAGARIRPLVGTPVPDGDQYVLDVVDLVVRGAAHLPNALGDAVHAVDVGLAEQPAVGVDRQLAHPATAVRRSRSPSPRRARRSRVPRAG